MPNYEKYNKIHDEIMKRLEAGEITTEQAREVNDLAFDKYITEDESTIIESVRDIINKISDGIFNFKIRNDSYESITCDISKLDEETVDKIKKYKDTCKSFDNDVKKAIDDAWVEFDEKYNTDGLQKSLISINPKFEVYATKCYRKNKLQRVEILLTRQYASSKSFKSTKNVERFANIVTNKLMDVYNDMPESIRELNIPPLPGWDTEKPFTMHINSSVIIKKISPKDAEKLLGIKD